MDDKLTIRREVRSLIKAMSTEAKQTSAEAIFKAVELNKQFTEANCVALYCAMHDEVPTHDTLLRWRSMGKRVVVPRVEGEIMRFYDYTPESMTIGAFGIEEPTGDCEVEASAIDLIIVPARAFSPSGVRLGRGGGFYDKYMSLPKFRAYKLGVAFACQIFDTLPCDPHDILVDSVIWA